MIPCGKRKIWDKYPDKGAVRAEEAYIGVLRQLTLGYAKKFIKEWVTISAKHGFLLPSDLVQENYDLTFQPNNPEVVTVNQLKYQLQEKKLDQYDHIIILTGKKYQKTMEKVFDHAKLVEFPLLGTKGIGDMQNLLKESINKNQPLHKKG
ncbi:hypothetical protein SAMN04487944_11475 [Gracilibacillus ureilyticus]|uniref:DUF6884 domain-containing protein n=1 Tax=Gracilibacillus ureilyticus TaxID=531814 RepID=A0A1H9TN08_9BACI|nr:hypothetical protein SAMN04487944_11475 [Gracilibacillus ureilyticus]